MLFFLIPHDIFSCHTRTGNAWLLGFYFPYKNYLMPEKNPVLFPSCAITPKNSLRVSHPLFHCWLATGTCVCKAEDPQLPPCPSQFGYKTRIHAAESIILYNWVLIFLCTHQCWSQWDRTCCARGFPFLYFLKNLWDLLVCLEFGRYKRSSPLDSLALKVIFFQNWWCCSKY